MNLNEVRLAGNLTRDPESRPAGHGVVCKFGMATNIRLSRDKKETCFVDVEAWGSVGEVIQKYLISGSPIYIEGRLKLDQWNDQAGNKRQKLRVVAKSMQFVGRKDPGEVQQNSSGEHQHNAFGGGAMTEDDIPF